MLVSNEWAGYQSNRKTLRVSFPEGIQRSTYFVSMPLKYGIPLTASMMLLHWTVSQSVFVVRVVSRFSDGTLDPGSSLTISGYSPLGIMICMLLHNLTPLPFLARANTSLSLGGYKPLSDYVCTALIISGILLIALLLLGLRRFPQGMPLASSCSAAISASCHQPLPDDQDAYRFPVQWGEVSVDDRDAQGVEVGHCCFTTARDVEAPVAGMMYA